MKTTESSGKTITAAPTMTGHKPEVQRPQLPPLEKQQQAALRGHRLESLPLGAPDDHYEQEADRAATQVVEHLESGSGPSGPIQATPTPGPAVQAKGEGGGSGGSAASALTQLPPAPGSSRLLEPAVRAPMERAFGADLSGVRLHTGRPAQQLNQSLDARATTVGPDIYFNRSEYDPDSTSGRELLAHELTHVLQQRQGGQRLQRAGEEDRRRDGASAATSSQQRPTRPPPQIGPSSSGPYGPIPSNLGAAAANQYDRVSIPDDGEPAAAANQYDRVNIPDDGGEYDRVDMSENAAPAAYGETSLAAQLSGYESTNMPLDSGRSRGFRARLGRLFRPRNRRR